MKTKKKLTKFTQKTSIFKQKSKEHRVKENPGKERLEIRKKKDMGKDDQS